MNAKFFCTAICSGWLILSGAGSVRAATTWTWAAGTTGNWSTTTDWTANGVPNGAGNIAQQTSNSANPTAPVTTLDTNVVIGQVVNTPASGRIWTITNNGTANTLTMDNSGGNTNPAGDHNACILSESSGQLLFFPNIIITNTDLEIGFPGYAANNNVTMQIGQISANTTITAGGAPRNLVLLAGGNGNTKGLTIWSAIGGSGSVITVSNNTASAGTVTLAGVVGPFASIVQNATNNSLLVLNAANTYTGATIITAGTIQLGVANAVPSASNVTDNGTLNLNSFSDIINGLSGSGIVDGSSGTPTLTIGANNSGGTFSGIIKNTTGTLSLIKTGVGTQTLSGTNTYSGSTTLSNGTLLVNGSIGSAAVTDFGGTLGGNGIINGPVAVQSGGTIQPGLGGLDTSTLTISNALNLAGNAIFYLNQTNAQSSSRIAGVTTLTMGGTLTVTNVGIPLEGGDTFTLFSAGSYANSFSVTNLPALTSGLYWTNTLSVNGTIAVVSTSAPTIPVVTNFSPSNVLIMSATLIGQILTTGGQTPTVRIYYGKTDGGTNPAAWTTNISLGLQAGIFSAAITNLVGNTTYYFAAAASNSVGTSWATPSQSFTTLPLILAVVTNLPASNEQGTSAVLNGNVVSIGSQIPGVTLYYGPVNGGTNAAAWANSIYIGKQGGSFSYTISGLATNTVYYFAAAANNGGISWAQPSLTFKTLPTASVVSVLTYHNNNARIGANTNEIVLSPANVNTNNFGRVIQYTNLDGYIFAQPLYVPNLFIPGHGTHNVVFVATENDSVYAFDADGNTAVNGGLLWSDNLGAAAQETIPNGFGGRYNAGQYEDLTPEVGITGTPVIDPASGTMYLDTFTYENSKYIHRIHALNITNGMEQPYSPVVVAATFPGVGVDSVGGVVTFNAQQELQRPAMTLAGGKLFVSYGSYADTNPYHGWVIGYNATNLVQLTNYVFNTTPNATTAVFGGNAAEGAIWMSGDGLCVDANTNLYFEVANGSFSANTNGGDYADSFVKLSTTNQLAVSDYFTPSNQAALQSSDQDLGSAGPLLLPDEVGSAAHPHLLIGSGKNRQLYLVDRDNMGQYNGSTGTNRDVQEFLPGTGGSCYSTPAYFNYTLYYAYAKGNPMYAYAITNGQIMTTPLSASANSFSGFGTTPSISANGTSNAIVWAIDPSVTANAYSASPAVLRAYSATNLAQQIYNSSQNLARDNPGNAVKYAVPTVANGKVYVGAQYALAVYGLTTFVATPGISPNGAAFTNSVTVTLTDATPGTSIYYTLDGTVPTTSSTLYTGPVVVTTTLNLQAIAVKSGAVNSGVASASFVNAAALGNGAGLLGQYWTNMTAPAFTNVSFNTPATLTRTDAVVNFNWSTNGPDPSIGQTNFTARWSGSVQPQYSETYTFTVVANDGVRLWVNGQLLVNNWTAQTSAITNSGSIALNAQELYNIRLEYFQGSGNALAQLFWSSPSTAQNIIPQTQLYPYTNPPPVVILASPANNSSYTAPASVTIGANADAAYNPVSMVSFYANGSLLGTVSNSPYAPLYELTAQGLGAASYTLTAVATDGSGLSSTSAPVSITVNAGSGQPYGLTTNPPVSAFLNMPTTFNGTLPALLSQTGAFSNTTNRTPAGGFIPYSPNTPLWSDGAVKSRYMAVPNNGGTITPDEQIGFLATNSWTFPAGTVFVKSFDLVVDQTNTNTPLRRLETRLLVRDINGAVYGVTYKWRPDNSDADLLTGSLTENILITNATGVSTQAWYYPSPADCLTCHTPVANYVLGVNTRQLNGSLTYPATGVTDNQLRALNHLGLFNPAFNEAGITNYAKLSSLTNLNTSLEQRARSYLDANCVQCHQPGGAGITFDARYDTPLAQQHITNYPASFSLGVDNACVIKARDPWRSVLLSRVNTVNQDIQMPDFRNLIDTNAVQVFTDWINSLPGIPALAPPVISPNGGSYYASVGVVLTPLDTNSTIYYTLDGTLPTTNSFVYSGALKLTGNTTVTAIAFETNYNNSVAASAVFVVQPLNFTSLGNVTGGQFQMGFAGVAGNTYVLLASTNLTTWTPISTNIASTNFFNFTDPSSTNYQNRFYRVQQQ